MKNPINQFRCKKFSDIITECITAKNEAITEVNTQELQQRWLASWSAPQHPSVRIKISKEPPGESWVNIPKLCAMITESYGDYIDWRRQIIYQLTQTFDAKTFSYWLNDALTIYFELSFPSRVKIKAHTAYGVSGFPYFEFWRLADRKIDSLEYADGEILPDDVNCAPKLKELERLLFKNTDLFKEIIKTEDKWRGFHCGLFCNSMSDMDLLRTFAPSRSDFTVSPIIRFRRPGFTGAFTASFRENGKPEFRFIILDVFGKDLSSSDEIKFIRNHMFVDVANIEFFKPPK